MRWKPRHTRSSNASCGSPPGITSHRSCSQICRNTGSPAGGADAELAALPVAEEHLAQVRLLDRHQAGVARERGRGLVRAPQRRHVDRVDAFVAQPLAEELGLFDTDRIERRIAVAVAQRERCTGYGRRRLAVADEEHRGRAGRCDEAVLAEPFGRSRGHPSTLGRR